MHAIVTILCGFPPQQQYHPSIAVVAPPPPAVDDNRSYGSNFAIYPTLAAEFFGATTAGPNYGLVFMVYGVCSFLAMVWLAAGEKTSARVFLVCAGFSLAGTASAALLRARRRHRSGGGGGKLSTC